jgi:hypothetical protein
VLLQKPRRPNESIQGSNPESTCYKPRTPLLPERDSILAFCAVCVLYGCETWSLTVREEHKLRVFENRVLRRIFGPKGDRVTGGWRKLHNEELHNLYSSPSIIRIIKSQRMRTCGTNRREEERV